MCLKTMINDGGMYNVLETAELVSADLFALNRSRESFNNANKSNNVANNNFSNGKRQRRGRVDDSDSHGTHDNNIDNNRNNNSNTRDMRDNSFRDIFREENRSNSFRRPGSSSGLNEVATAGCRRKPSRSLSELSATNSMNSHSSSGYNNNNSSNNNNYNSPPKPINLSLHTSSELRKVVSPLIEELKNLDAAALLSLIPSKDAKNGGATLDPKLGLTVPPIHDYITPAYEDVDDDGEVLHLVRYLHVKEVPHKYSVGIFVFPPHKKIPLHDHPNMVVLSRVLYGELEVKSFDLIPRNATAASPASNAAGDSMAAGASAATRSNSSAESTASSVANGAKKGASTGGSGSVASGGDSPKSTASSKKLSYHRSNHKDYGNSGTSSKSDSKGKNGKESSLHSSSSHSSSFRSPLSMIKDFVSLAMSSPHRREEEKSESATDSDSSSCDRVDHGYNNAYANVDTDVDNAQDDDDMEDANYSNHPDNVPPNAQHGVLKAKENLCPMGVQMPSPQHHALDAPSFAPDTPDDAPATISAPQVTCLFPYEGNCHTFVAGPHGAAVLDVLLPPYDTEEDRDCTFYHADEVMDFAEFSKFASSSKGVNDGSNDGSNEGRENGKRPRSYHLTPIDKPEDFHCLSGVYGRFGACANYADSDLESLEGEEEDTSMDVSLGVSA